MPLYTTLLTAGLMLLPVYDTVSRPSFWCSGERSARSVMESHATLSAVSLSLGKLMMLPS